MARSRAKDSKILLVPTWFKSDSYQVRVVRIKGISWAFLYDIQRICPNAKVPQRFVKLVRVPSKYPNKQFWTVPVIHWAGIEQMCSDSDDPEAFQAFLNDVLDKICYVPEVNYIEFAAHKGPLAIKEKRDCVTRAISTATGFGYYATFNQLGERQRQLALELIDFDPENADEYRRISEKTADCGISYPVMADALKTFGWRATVCDTDGKITKFRKGVVPDEGTYLIVLCHHLTCVINGVVRDSYDCTGCGEAQVLETWELEDPEAQQRVLDRGYIWKDEVKKP